MEDSMEILNKLEIKVPYNPTESGGKNLNRYFFKEDIQMANKHMKMCSTVLILEKCKSKLQ